MSQHGQVVRTKNLIPQGLWFYSHRLQKYWANFPFHAVSVHPALMGTCWNEKWWKMRNYGNQRHTIEMWTGPSFNWSTFHSQNVVILLDEWSTYRCLFSRAFILTQKLTYTAGNHSNRRNRTPEQQVVSWGISKSYTHIHVHIFTIVCKHGRQSEMGRNLLSFTKKMFAGIGLYLSVITWSFIRDHLIFGSDYLIFAGHHVIFVGGLLISVSDHLIFVFDHLSFAVHHLILVGDQFIFIGDCLIFCQWLLDRLSLIQSSLPVITWS